MTEQLSKRTAKADKRVGACVRAARVKAGLSQSKLAAALGITFRQLQRYEKGPNRIAVSTLLLIADGIARTDAAPAEVGSRRRGEAPRAVTAR